jgi:iron complex outermembrane receptor protein
MHGMSNPAGVVNYVTKRPTSERMARLSLTSINARDYHLHGDFGGRFNNSDFGYRINVATQDGGSFVEHQEVHKYLLSTAFDWRPNDRVLLDMDMSIYYKKSKGMQITFAPDTGKLSDLNPRHIDGSKLYGQKWSFQEDRYSQIGTRLTWKLNNIFTLRSSLRYSKTSSERLNVNSSGISDFKNTYQQTYYHIAPADYTNITQYAYLDSHFTTGPISHLLTTGFSIDKSDAKTSPDRTANGSIPGVFSFQHPTYVDKPDYIIDRRPKVDYTKNRYTKIVMGDEIIIDKSWSALIGVSHFNIDQRNFNLNTGIISSRYEKSTTSPTVSLLYKPIPTLTTYVSYLEAFEQGGTAPDIANGRPVINAGEIMSPMVSKQNEAGIKMTLNNVFITVALFKIDKANQYVDPGIDRYVQDGRQIHKGLELTTTGRISSRLNIVGGLTWMDAKIRKNATNPVLEGKRPVGVPKILGKLYFEYDLASIPGLTMTGGVFYSGSNYMDNLNTDHVSGAATYDLGVRYNARIAGQDTTLRINASNITDKRYWLPYGYINDPRYVSFSAQVRF